MLSEMLGKESGILMTSGTQSNLCAVLTHCARGEEVIIGDKYHIFIDEAAGASVLGGVAMAPIKTGEDNEMLPENISNAVKPDDPHCPISKLLCLENTVKEAIENSNGANNSTNNHLSSNGINKHCLFMRFLILAKK